MDTAQSGAARAIRVLSSWPVRIIGTIICLWLLFRNINMHEAFQTLRYANPSMVCIALLATVLVLACGMLEWAILIRSATMVPWRKLAYSYAKSLMPSHLIPTGFGGDATRIYDMCGDTGTAAATAATLVGRLGSTSALMFWALIGSIQLHNPIAIAASGGALVVMLSLWLAAMAPNAVAYTVVQWTKPYSKLAPRAVLRFASELKDLRSDRKSIALSLLVSTIGWGLQNWILSYMSQAVGIHVPWYLFAVSVPFSLIATMAPFALNGYGLREGILVAILVKSGLAPADAAAVALLVDLQMVPFIALSALLWLPGVKMAGDQEDQQECQAEWQNRSASS